MAGAVGQGEEKSQGGVLFLATSLQANPEKVVAKLARSDQPCWSRDEKRESRPVDKKDYKRKRRAQQALQDKEQQQVQDRLGELLREHVEDPQKMDQVHEEDSSH